MCAEAANAVDHFLLNAEEDLAEIDEEVATAFDYFINEDYVIANGEEE